jgi:hypothetical protein
MTFKEAFETGCRFKLPKSYVARDDWPDGWYWVKHDNNHICITTNEQIISLDELFDAESERDQHHYDIYKHSNDWYLHSDDEKNYKFRNKIEEIINET